MSLVIFISSNKVIISKYQLEFTYSPPPKNLTQAAMGAYQLLRRSESIQIESSRDEREEAITLLKQYGQALFDAIMPSRFRSQVSDAGGLFIYATDPKIINLPWELLYDGSSFFSLTQGVVRISESKVDQPMRLVQKSQSSLKISLNAYTPVKFLTPGNRFVSFVEELAAGNIADSPRVQLTVDGNASHTSILGLSDVVPDIFLFSGFDSERGWMLKKQGDALEEQYLSFEQLTPVLKESVKKGLRILILNTASQLKDSDRLAGTSLNRYFDLGIPYIISVNGRMARHRFQEYFHNFIHSLTREESILRAHRHAINSIQSSLPLSWDWSWIQLHLNKLILEQPSEEPPLPPFQFDSESKSITRDSFRPQNQIVNFSKFYGSTQTLLELTQALTGKSKKEIISLQSDEGMPIEVYLSEFVRRQLTDGSLIFSTLYYQHWGFHSGQQSKLPASQLSKLFSAILDEKTVMRYFDSSVVDVLPGNDGASSLKVLAVYFPPEKLDPAFDKWLKEKMKGQWQVVFLSCTTPATKIPLLKIDCDLAESNGIRQSFEDELPEKWIDLVVDPLPPQMKNLSLLETISRYNSEKFIKLITKEQNPKVLWFSIFHEIFSNLSSQQIKIFFSLYLVKVKYAKADVKLLFAGRNIDDDLARLQHLGLIETDIGGLNVWVPIHYQHQLHRLDLMPGKSLLTFGQELLQRQIIALKDFKTPNQNQISAFQYSINQLATLGPLENPIQRNLQYAKKIIQYFGESPEVFYSTIKTSLELALLSGKKQLLHKTLFSVLNVVENLPYDKQVIRIYEWLMRSEEKQRNWLMVSDVMMKLAKVYTKIDKKERAIGLITSALQLNNDIKNFSSRFQNLISIALLLLDLGEFEKVRKLIDNTDFDLKRLSEEEIVKLWLIDGHLLYEEKKFDEAAKSFLKTFDKANPSVPENLLAKTYLNLADIFNQRNDTERYEESLEKAVQFFDQAGNHTDAMMQHEKLADLLLSSGKSEAAIVHLEWLYNVLKQEGEIERARDLADQLGGLYYKVGDKSKSTSYYSIAQGI